MSKDFKRYNSEIEKYNEVAVKVVKKYGFLVNDLYALSKTLPLEAHSDDVHYYTQMGTEVFSKHVLSVVKEALGIDEEIEYKEVLYTSKPVGR